MSGRGAAPPRQAPPAGAWPPNGRAAAPASIGLGGRAPPRRAGLSPERPIGSGGGGRAALFTGGVGGGGGQSGVRLVVSACGPGGAVCAGRGAQGPTGAARWARTEGRPVFPAVLLGVGVGEA